MPVCPACGAELNADAGICYACGAQINQSENRSSQRRPQPEERSKKPLIAGILMIIAFIMAVISSGILLVDPTPPPGYPPTSEGALIVCGSLVMIFGFVLLGGAICAIKRIKWGFALGASIVGIFSLGFLGLGSLLSLISVILIAISKDEFGKKSQKIPPAYQPSPSPRRGVNTSSAKKKNISPTKTQKAPPSDRREKKNKIHCIECGAANNPDNQHCINCGCDLSETRLYSDAGTKTY